MKKYYLTHNLVYVISQLLLCSCNSPTPPFAHHNDNRDTDSLTTTTTDNSRDEEIPLVGRWEYTFESSVENTSHPDSVTFTIHLNADKKKSFRQYGESCYGWMDFTSSPAHTYYYEIDSIEYLGNQQYVLLHPNWMGTADDRDTVVYNPQNRELIYYGTQRKNWKFQYVDDVHPFYGNWIASYQDESDFYLRNITLNLYEKYKSQEKFYFKDKECYGHFVYNTNEDFITGLITDVDFVDYNFARIQWINTQDSLPEVQKSYLYYNFYDNCLSFDNWDKTPWMSERVE